MALRALTKKAVKAIIGTIDRLFHRLKGRILGPMFIKAGGDKKTFTGHRPALSLPGIYKQAAAEEGAQPNDRMLHSLATIAESYLDAQREATKAKVVHAVNVWVAQDPDSDVEDTLVDHLSPIWDQVTANVTKIVDTEGTAARNLGAMEGISKAAAGADIDDPYVFFITVRDDDVCEECKTIHLLPNEKTPRVFLLSEVKGGYHKPGERSPSVGGLHPSCRCTMTGILPGYGFDDGGGIRYVGKVDGLLHNEYVEQQLG
jgi:hypothetical protein